MSTKKDKATEEPVEALIDATAKAKLLQIETKTGTIGLSSSSSIDIQPSSTVFGLRLAKNQGTIVPTLLFDTKKMRPPNQFNGAQNAVDEALGNYEDHNEAPS